MSTIGLFSGSGMWKKLLGRFAISGSNIYDCWCVLQGILQVFVHMEVQNKCDAILRAFLIVGVGFLWYCWNSLSLICLVR
jgi:hypothetical protein